MNIFLQFGGPVVWILAFGAVCALVVFFERLLEFRRAQIDSQDFLKGVINVLDSGNDEEALAICEDESAPVAQIVASSKSVMESMMVSS